MEDSFSQGSQERNNSTKPVKPWVKWVVLPLLLALLAVGGWHGWQWWQYQSLKKVSVTPLVPKDALLLAEITQPAALWHQIQHSPYQKWLSTFGQWQQLQAQTDSLFQYLNPALEATALQSMPLYMSVHNSGSQGLGTVYYLPLAPIGGPDAGKSLLAEWQAKLTPNLRKSTRRYKGQSITDIRLNDSTTLSILATTHSWAFSLKGGLIDDVVRQTQERETASWLTAAEPVANPKLPQLKLYTNGGQLKTLLEKVSQVPVPAFVDRLMAGATLTLQDADHTLVLEGKVTTSASEQKCFSDSLPTGQMQMLKLVPHTASVVMHVGQAHALYKFLAKQEPANDSYKSSALGEAMVVYAEHPDPNKLPMLVAVERTGAEKWVRQSLKSSQQNHTSGSLGKQPWFLYNTGNVANSLLGYPVQGMEQAYVTVLEDRWILAASTLPFLQQVLEDYANAETWDLNEEMRGYLQNLEPNHKALFMVNPARTAQQQRNWLKPEWLEATMALSQPDTGLGTVVVQLFSTEDQDEAGTTSLRMAVYPQPAVAASADEPIKNLRTTTLPGALVGGPRLWRSLTDKGLGALVADTLNTLYWIDKKGKVQHTYALKQPLVAEPRFTSPQECYALTLGAVAAFNLNAKDLSAFVNPIADSILPQFLRPAQLPGASWLLGTVTGQVYALDRVGKPAASWNSAQPFGALVAAPEQFSVENMPVVLALEKQGWLHVWQGNGTALPGFPVRLPARVNQAAFVSINRTLTDSRISVLTEQGVLLEYDFTGVLKRSVQFLRTSGKCRFTMAIEPGLQTYSVLVQDGDSITAYDPAAIKIAQLKGPGYGSAEVQYYYFGAGNEVWAVRQPAVNLLWLHTRRQVLGGGLALNSTAPVNVLYSRASRAWFVLRNAGHATFLTALRNKAWPGVRASAVYVDEPGKIDSTRAPLRTLNAEVAADIPTLPYQSSHPYLLHPNGMEAPGLSGRALTQLTLAYLLLNNQKKVEVPAVLPAAPKASVTKLAEKAAAKPDGKAVPANKTTKADPKAAIKDKEPAKKKEDSKASKPAKEAKTTEKKADAKPAASTKSDLKAKAKTKAKEKPTSEPKEKGKAKPDKDPKASTKSSSTTKEKATSDKKASSKTVTSSAKKK